MMKKALLLLTLILCSCKSLLPADLNILAHYSKSPCTDNCPVYDVWFYENGTVLYNGVYMVANEGKMKIKLNPEELQELSLLFEKNMMMPTKEIDITQDVPITRITYNKRIYDYIASSAIDERLKVVNSKIEDFVFQRFLSENKDVSK